MREILFRSKTYDGEWVEGSLHIEYGETTKDGKRNTDYRILGMRGECRYIIPETVGQYTGLTDKNGTRIFEGDILKGYIYPFFNEEKGDFNYFAEIVWFDNCPAFGYEVHKNPLSKVNGISAGNTDYLEDFYPPCWEVIGNIHDNPELLKGGVEE